MNIPTKVLRSSFINYETYLQHQHLAKRYFKASTKKGRTSNNQNGIGKIDSQFGEDQFIFNLNDSKQNSKEALFKWFFSMSLSDKIKAVSIENKWFATMIQLMFIKFKHNQKIKFQLKFEDITSEEYCMQQIINSGASISLGNDQNLDTFFNMSTDIPTSDEQSVNESLFLKEIRFYSLKDSNDTLGLSSNVLENEEMFKVSFDTVLRLYNWDFPDWFNSKEYNSISEFIIAYIEQVLGIRYWFALDEKNKRLSNNIASSNFALCEEPNFNELFEQRDKMIQFLSNQYSTENEKEKGKIIDLNKILNEMKSDSSFMSKVRKQKPENIKNYFCFVNKQKYELFEPQLDTTDNEIVDRLKKLFMEVSEQTFVDELIFCRIEGLNTLESYFAKKVFDQLYNLYTDKNASDLMNEDEESNKKKSHKIKNENNIQKNKKVKSKKKKKGGSDTQEIKKDQIVKTTSITADANGNKIKITESKPNEDEKKKQCQEKEIEVHVKKDNERKYFSKSSNIPSRAVLSYSNTEGKTKNSQKILITAASQKNESKNQLVKQCYLKAENYLKEKDITGQHFSSGSGKHKSKRSKRKTRHNEILNKEEVKNKNVPDVSGEYVHCLVKNMFTQIIYEEDPIQETDANKCDLGEHEKEYSRKKSHSSSNLHKITIDNLRRSMLTRLSIQNTKKSSITLGEICDKKAAIDHYSSQAQISSPKSFGSDSNCFIETNNHKIIVENSSQTDNLKLNNDSEECYSYCSSTIVPHFDTAVLHDKYSSVKLRGVEKDISHSTPPGRRMGKYQILPEVHLHLKKKKSVSSTSVIDFKRRLSEGKINNHHKRSLNVGENFKPCASTVRDYCDSYENEDCDDDEEEFYNSLNNPIRQNAGKYYNQKSYQRKSAHNSYSHYSSEGHLNNKHPLLNRQTSNQVFCNMPGGYDTNCNGIPFHSPFQVSAYRPLFYDPLSFPQVYSHYYVRNSPVNITNIHNIHDRSFDDSADGVFKKAKSEDASGDYSYSYSSRGESSSCSSTSTSSNLFKSLSPFAESNFLTNYPISPQYFYPVFPKEDHFNFNFNILSKIENWSRHIFHHRLHNDILDFSKSISEATNYLKDVKIYIINFLEKTIHQILNHQKIEMDIYGSYATDLAIESSDIDINIHLIEDKKTYNEFSDDWMNCLCQGFQELNIFNEVVPILTASVPVLKLLIDPMRILEKESKEYQKFIEIKSQEFYKNFQFDVEELLKVKIDFTFSDHHDNKNSYTKLSLEWSKQTLLAYPEVKPIIHTLKRYLQLRKLNSSFKGGLSSHSMFLLVVSFLKYKQRQFLNVGIILMEFFEFYGKIFNFNQTLVNVNLFNPYIFSNEFLDSYLNIMDPISGVNVSKNSFRFNEVRESFALANDYLNQCKILFDKKDLQSNSNLISDLVLRHAKVKIAK